jgi:(R,R)-butanediol dehydrogenase/meso-butanediol dehydrogenase/diacetyl reductase
MSATPALTSSGATTTRAVRWHAAGDVRFEAVALRPPGPGEVLIDVAYCGVCGSDLHEIADGPHAVPTSTPHPLSGAVAPVTLGHEFSGVVRALGPDVDGPPPGTPVAIEPNYRCGSCTPCREGRYEVCDCFGFAGLMGDGGMAEQAVVPAYMVRPLPVGFDLVAAAVLEPAAVSLHAIRRSTFKAGDNAVVVGLGPVGLLLCTLLARRGAAMVIGVDPDPARRALSARLGAHTALNPADDVLGRVRSLTDGDGAEVSFEAVGAQSPFELALSSVRSGGEVVLVGLVDSLTIPAFDMVNRQQRLTTSVGYRDCHDELIDLHQAGALDLRSLVTRIVSLEEAPATLSLMTAGDDSGVKTLVHCGGEPYPAS